MKTRLCLTFNLFVPFLRSDKLSTPLILLLVETLSKCNFTNVFRDIETNELMNKIHANHSDLEILDRRNANQSYHSFANKLTLATTL